MVLFPDKQKGLILMKKTNSFPDVAITLGDEVEVADELSVEVEDTNEVEVVDEISVEVEDTNTEKDFTFALVNNTMIYSTISITDGVEVFEFANDLFVGDKGGTGTLNQITGQISLTFNTAPVADILSTYKHYGNATEKDFTFALVNNNVKYSTISITDGVEVFEIANDLVVGDKGGTGTLNPITGQVSLTFNTAPVADILSTYNHYGNAKVFVSDTFNHRVLVLSLNGVWLNTIGGFGTANGKLNQPCGLAFNADGSEIHVVEKGNNRVSVFNSSTMVFKQTYGSKGHGATSGLFNPTDIFNSTTNMFVTDTDNNRVVKFVLDGSTWKEATSGYVAKSFTTGNTSKTIGVLGVVANVSRSGFHLTDTYTSIIVNYNDSWVAQTDTATKGKTGEDKVMYPKGMFLDGSATLVVADTGNFKVVEIDLS